MDRTELQALMEWLGAQLANPARRPVTDTEKTQARIALRNAFACVREMVDDLDFELAQQLTRDGHVTIRCAGPGCGRWVLAKGSVGRRRKTCSAACRQAYARAQRETL